MSREMIEKILEYIDQHINEKISLKDLAAFAGYSPFYFSALFSKVMGVSVTTYIRIRKLQYSLLSILEGEKIVDISMKYGFESHEGFTRSFTRLFGSTPKTTRKYLTAYTVPTYVIPNISLGKDDFDMKVTKNLFEDMHQILFAFLQEAIHEAKLGYCTEINIYLLPDNQIRVTDDGRGLPLSEHDEKNQEVFSKTLAGHPITSLDYERMEELNSPGLQVAGSLCERLKVVVYKNNKIYSQDYIRGIAQYEIEWKLLNHKSGMEILLLPDREIFGDMKFSKTRIRQWLDDNLEGLTSLNVNIIE